MGFFKAQRLKQVPPSVLRCERQINAEISLFNKEQGL